MKAHASYPGEWDLRDLGSICQIQIGGTPSRDVLKYWAAPSDPDGLPWVSIGDLTTPTIEQTKELITEAGARNSNVKLVRKGTTLMSFKLSIGKMARAGVDLYTNEAIAAFEPNSDELDPDYLFHALPGVLGGLVVDQAIKGATLNKKKLAKIPLPLPLRPEQASIAEVLNTLDEAIRGSDSVVSKLTTMKQAITHQLLTCGVDDSGRHRDRRSSPSPFKPAPYGLIPQSWEVQPAAALCEEIVVGIVVQPSKYYQEKGVPMLRSANVRTNRIDPSDLVFMSPADNQRMLKSQIRAGNVVTVRTGSPGGPGTSCVVPPEFDGANCIDIVISRLGPGVLPEYFSQWLNSDLGKGQVTKGQIGLAQQHFNVGELKKLLVYVPPITEQRRIVAAFFEFEETIRLESERRSRLQELRSGLSSDLLTGHVRTIHS